MGAQDAQAQYELGEVDEPVVVVVEELKEAIQVQRLLQSKRSLELTVQTSYGCV